MGKFRYTFLLVKDSIYVECYCGVLPDVPRWHTLAVIEYVHVIQYLSTWPTRDGAWAELLDSRLRMLLPRYFAVHWVRDLDREGTV